MNIIQYTLSYVFLDKNYLILVGFLSKIHIGGVVLG